MGYSVLLIEDQSLAAHSLYDLLLAAQQTTILVHTPEEATRTLTRQWPDLILFNLLLGSLKLANFKQEIAKTDLNIPHLILMDPPRPADIPPEICIHPPYTQEYLQQRMNSLVDPDRFCRLGQFILDTMRKRLLRTGTCYKLTPKLCDLLKLFMKNQGQIVLREVIMKEIWETDYMGDTRTLDVHIRWIREKIEDNPSHPKHLLTIRGMGYRFVVDAESTTA